MNQSNKYINPINPPIRTNKNFVYKGKKYPVDFSLVKKYSNYFYKNRSNYKFINDIEIKPDNYEITDESIPMFIACCQNKPFEINDSNIFSLFQLSIQYDVPVLHDVSIQYIEENQKQLIFPSILYKLHNQNSNSKIDFSTEEEFISSNFFDFIDND